MLEFIQYFYIALPWVIAVVFPIGAMATMLIGRRTAIVWVAAYFGLLFFFPNNGWGMLEYDPRWNLYGRGANYLFFPAINVLLFGLALQAFFARRMRLNLPVTTNLALPSVLFGVVLLGNIVVAMMLDDVKWFHVANSKGLIQIFNFMLAVYVLTSVLRDREDLDRAINFLMACVVVRGLYGAGRFLFMGGDPANAYANYQRLDVKLTFFDINDILLATIVAFIAAWRLSNGLCRSNLSRFLHWGVVVLETFLVLFSYRRTGIGGFGLALILFALLQRSAVRVPLLLGSLLVGLPAVFYSLSKRFAGSGRIESWLDLIAPDISSQGDLEFSTGRFAELHAAWAKMVESPIWGTGAWGAYSGFRYPELSWHRGDFTWMHSGVLHLMLKSGLIGLAIALLFFVLYVKFIRNNRAWMDVQNRGYAMAGAAGLLFNLPNFLVGTPLVEFRTMQMAALCVALPYMARAVSQAGAFGGAQPAPRPSMFWTLSPPPQVLARRAAGRL